MTIDAGTPEIGQPRGHEGTATSPQHGRANVPAMGDLAGLFGLISATRPAHAWPTVAKCQALAALVIANRSRTIVEIGVWTGDSLIPMLLAQKHAGIEGARAYAIDPWANAASVAGQDGENEKWWGKVDHDHALAKFAERLARLALDCTTVRSPSDAVDPAIFEHGIDLIHVDGNHGEQAVRDIERFGARVPVGGWMVLDDLHWTGGHVARGRDRAVEMGFVERYSLDNGCAMQRTSIR
jgi:predicted O-methyltransferase YrrM